MNCFARFENILPHSIIMPSLMTVESQIPPSSLHIHIKLSKYRAKSVIIKRDKVTNVTISEIELSSKLSFAI